MEKCIDTDLRIGLSAVYLIVPLSLSSSLFSVFFKLDPSLCARIKESFVPTSPPPPPPPPRLVTPLPVTSLTPANPSEFPGKGESVPAFGVRSISAAMD